jgi:hypothetical protein
MSIILSYGTYRLYVAEEGWIEKEQKACAKALPPAYDCILMFK